MYSGHYEWFYAGSEGEASIAGMHEPLPRNSIGDCVAFFYNSQGPAMRII